MKMEIAICLTMKIETATILNYENRNCKYAQLRKQRLQICLRMKIGTASMLKYENRNCNMHSDDYRDCK